MSVLVWLQVASVDYGGGCDGQWKTHRRRWHKHVYGPPFLQHLILFTPKSTIPLFPQARPQKFLRPFLVCQITNTYRKFCGCTDSVVFPAWHMRRPSIVQIIAAIRTRVVLWYFCNMYIESVAFCVLNRYESHFCIAYTQARIWASFNCIKKFALSGSHCTLGSRP